MIRVHSGGRTLRRPSGSAGPQPEKRLSTASPLVQPGQVLTLSPEEARRRIGRGETFDALIVSGSLRLSGNAALRTLPSWLRCTALHVDDCTNLTALPLDLYVDRVSARRCPQLWEVEGRLSVREELDLSGSGLRVVHADLHAARLTLADCTELERLDGAISVTHLDLRGCGALSILPDSLHVTQSIDVADSGLRALPRHLRAGLRWRGVPVDARTAFEPESLGGREVMAIRNVQRRRVLLERIGLDRFLADVGGLVIDRDRDAGGERSLIRVPFDDDEDLVAVLVQCPSTGGRYALRVPPSIRSCREAVAWMAGLSVTAYHPTQEA